MVKIAREPDPKKIKELKKKLQDDSYITFAIQKIAQELTKKLTQKD